MQKILLLVSCLASVGIAEARQDLWSGDLWPDDKGVHINANGGGVKWHDGRSFSHTVPVALKSYQVTSVKIKHGMVVNILRSV